MKFYIFLFFILCFYIHNSFAINLAQGEARIKANAGFGEYSDVDDYEGINLLGRRCAEFAQEGISKGNCQVTCSKEINGSGFLQIASNLQDDFSKYILSNYATRILSSEVKNCSIGAGVYSACSSSAVKTSPSQGSILASELSAKLPDRENVRKNAMQMTNALSAALLYYRANLASANEPAVKAYKKRIELSFPFLFTPQENAYKDLINVLKQEGVPVPSENLMQGDVFLQSRAMGVITKTMSINPALKAKMDLKLSQILDQYGREMEKDLSPSNLLCFMDAESLFRRYPAIVNQALIDLPTDARDVLGRTLCKSKDYYNPDSHDSDCDGLADALDQKPLDTYSPKSEFKINKRDAENPPFGTWGIYNLKKEGNKIVLNLDLGLRLDPDLTGEVKNHFIQGINQCLKERLQNDFKQSFEVLKQEKSAFFPSDSKLEILFDIKEVSNNSGYSVHKCWCSTCSLTYIFEGKTKVIPRSMCLENLKSGIKPASLNVSQEEMNAMASAYQAASANGTKVWWHQEDAGNLTVKTQCDTIRHETVHRFGLPDEYTAEYYPFNRVGIRESLMNHQTNGRVLPRHLKKILAPISGGIYCSL